MRAIAKNLNVSQQTLYKYLNLEGLDTIKNARRPAVEKIENSMFRSACGYTIKTKKYEKVKRTHYENGKKADEWEEMVEYEVEEYVKPDTTAAIFLLKNWGDYMNEPRAMEYRRREVEIKERQEW